MATRRWANGPRGGGSIRKPMVEGPPATYKKIKHYLVCGSCLDSSGIQSWIYQAKLERDPTMCCDACGKPWMDNKPQRASKCAGLDVPTQSVWRKELERRASGTGQQAEAARQLLALGDEDGRKDSVAISSATAGQTLRQAEIAKEKALAKLTKAMHAKVRIEKDLKAKDDEIEQLRAAYAEAEADEIPACKRSTPAADAGHASLDVPAILAGTKLQLNFGEMFDIDRNWTEEEKAEILARKARLEEEMSEKTHAAFGEIKSFLEEQRELLDKFKVESQAKRRRTEDVSSMAPPAPIPTVAAVGEPSGASKLAAAADPDRIAERVQEVIRNGPRQSP